MHCAWLAASVGGFGAVAVAAGPCPPELGPVASSARTQYGAANPPAISGHTLWDPDGPGPLGEVLVLSGVISGVGSVPSENVAVYNGVTWSALPAPMFGTPQMISLTSHQDELIGAMLDGAGNRAVFVYRGASWRRLGDAGFPANVVRSQGGRLFAGTLGAGGLYEWTGSSWALVSGGLAGDAVRVDALAEFSGRLIVAGRFQSAGGVAAGSIAALGASGFSALPGLDGDVRALAVHAGALYAGGTFAINGVPVNVARWSGTAWEPLTDVDPPPINISAITWVNGRVMVGGVRAAGEGGATTFELVDGFWVPALDGTNPEALAPEVAAFARFGDEVFALGPMTLARGDREPGVGISRWSGSEWRTLFNGPSLSVRGMVTYAGALHAFGDFVTFGAAGARRVARFDGTVWSGVGGGVGSGPSTRASVLDAAVFENQLAVVGRFRNVGNTQDADGIAVWNGSFWRALPGLGDVRAVEFYRGDLYVAGAFGTPGSLARYRPAMNTWEAVGAGQTVGTITDMLVWNDRLVLAGTQLSALGGVPVRGIGIYDGVRFAGLGEGLTGAATPGVNALGVYRGRLVAGGTFTRSGATILNHVALWDGTRWRALGSGVAAVAPSVASVEAVLGVGDDLFITGEFQSAGGAPAQRLARWNGVSWSGVGLGLAIPGQIDGTFFSSPGLALHEFGGSVYVGGHFRLAGGVDSPFLARVTLPCAADNNCDGLADLFDYLDFAADFAAEDARADFNRDGQIDFFDYLDFVEAFAREC